MLKNPKSDLFQNRDLVSMKNVICSAGRPMHGAALGVRGGGEGALPRAQGRPGAVRREVHEAHPSAAVTTCCSVLPMRSIGDVEIGQLWNKILNFQVFSVSNNVLRREKIFVLQGGQSMVLHCV